MLDHSSSAGTESRERRNTDRRTVALAAEVLLAAGTSVPLSTSNVSSRGVFVCSPHVPSVGATLHLLLHLPDGPVESVATVVRALPGVGMGCRISIPGGQERGRWQSWLESLTREILLEDVLVDDPRDLFDFTWCNAPLADSH